MTEPKPNFKSQPQQPPSGSAAKTIASPHTKTNLEVGHEPQHVVRRDLPCVGCGYDLKGISPDSACPECGLGVRRTLLYVIDPAASEIAPLRNGYWLAAILVLVPAILVTAVVILWIPHIQFAYENYQGILRPNPATQWNLWKAFAGFLAIVSGLLTFGLQNPTGKRVRRSYLTGLWLARLSLIFWGGMVIIIAIYDETNGTWQASLYDGEQIDLFRSVLRAGGHLTLILAVVGFPKVVRFLALRSLYHRISQMSRQGFLAMGFALLITLAGDSLWIITGWIQQQSINAGTGGAPRFVEQLALISAMLTLVGSGMLTLALFNAMMDAIRLAVKINGPRYTHDQIVD